MLVLVCVLLFFKEDKKSGRNLSFQENCNIVSKPCGFSFKGKFYTLEFSPHPILGNKPLEIKLKGDVSLLNNVHVKFKAKNLESSPNKPRLDLIHSWGISGETILPHNGIRTIAWLGELNFIYSSENYFIPFDFQTSVRAANATN